MNKRTMLAHVATLTAALNYVVSVDENDNKITPELCNALNALVQDTKTVFEFDDANLETFTENEGALFEMWAGSDDVSDVTGMFF